MKTREWNATLEGNKDLGGGYHVLSLRTAKSLGQPPAGSFLMLSVGSEPDILLRRPMALFDLRPSRGGSSFDILYNVVGRGTRELSKLRPRQTLSLLAPIGNGFSKPTKGQSIWVVAGGIGIAPFLLYGRQISKADHKRLKVLFGFRSKDQLGILKAFKAAGIRPKCAIEGPGGDFRGTVVDLLRRELKESTPDRILTCGPEKMMDAVRIEAQKYQIPVEASLETKMACGMGVCLSCVTRHGPEGKFRLVCQEGPIFEFTGGP